MADSSGTFRTSRSGPSVFGGMAGWLIDSGRTPVYSSHLEIIYWCAAGHETRVTFAPLNEEEIPALWDCGRCGKPAARKREDAPPNASDQYKSHLDYAKERRSPDEANLVLEEALEKLRARRSEAAEAARAQTRKAD